MTTKKSSLGKLPELLVHRLSHGTNDSEKTTQKTKSTPFTDTDNRLKKLSRGELLELLIRQTKENEQLKAALEERDMQFKNAGTLAEACASLNGVFKSADNAAKQYINNAKRLKDSAQAEYDRIIAEAKQKANELIAEAQEYDRLITEAGQVASATIAEAHAQRIRKVQEYYDTHPSTKPQTRKNQE